MACEKKIHGSADLGRAKKKHSQHLSSVACEKKIIHHGPQNRQNAKKDISHNSGIPDSDEESYRNVKIFYVFGKIHFESVCL